MISNDALGTCFHFKSERNVFRRKEEKVRNQDAKRVKEEVKKRKVKNTAENDVVFEIIISSMEDAK